MTKRISELLLLSIFLLIAILLYKSTAGFPDMVQGSTATYIRFLAISLGTLCLLEVILWLRKQERDEKKKLNLATAPARFWALLTVMFGYSMLLEPLGFYLASALFMPSTMFILGTRNKLHIILTSGGVLLFVYLVFAKLLGVPLPESYLF